MIYVVDTNVPVVANQRSGQASPICVNSCIAKIENIMKNGKIAVDDQWLIVKEYRTNLNLNNQQLVGNRFLRWVLTNLRNGNKCDQVSITSINPNDPTQFKEFPSDRRLKKFDPSDRKFVAVSLVHPRKPPILQAVDTKWWEFKDILKENQVTVEFLCMQDCMG